jgi:predicted aconitase
VLELDDRDRALLAGEGGPAAALAMRLVVRLAEVQDATGLIDVESAHIDACLYHGHAGLEFAERLASEGGRVAVPTTLNVSSLDLLHPDLVRSAPDEQRAGRALMDAYVAMGARPTWTCAPYLLPTARPAFASHVAWGESNAIVFANAVLGARTERYGDFTDIACALTGRAPDVGLHRDEHRVAKLVVDARSVTGGRVGAELVPVLVGHLVGDRVGTRVAAILGLEDSDEDGLRQLGAAAASSGAVGLFHAVGATPEAPTLAAAFGEDAAAARAAEAAAIVLTDDDLDLALADLRHDTGRPFVGASVGTPHASLAEVRRLATLVSGRTVHPDVELAVSMGRDVLAELERDGTLAVLETAGVTVVTDTCTYIVPSLRRADGLYLTNSGKWAYYAPGNIGVDVALAPLEVCVESCVTGRLPAWLSSGPRP